MAKHNCNIILSCMPGKGILDQVQACVKGLLQLCKRTSNTGHPAHPGTESLNKDIDPSARINWYKMAHLAMRAHREAAVALACAGRSPGRAVAHPGQALREARRPCTGRCQS